jgi:hypothetical protein
MPEEFDPLRILAGLRAHNVSYVLVGGLAAALRGWPMQTDDVDIYLPDDDENFERLVLVLQELGARPAVDAPSDVHRVSYDTSAGRLDILESREMFVDLNANAADLDIDRGVVARVAAVDDLADLKREAGDLVAAVQLSAMAGSARQTDADASGSVDPDPPPKGRIDRILRRLGEVDVFLDEVNKGHRSLRWKKGQSDQA